MSHWTHGSDTNKESGLIFLECLTLFHFLFPNEILWVCSLLKKWFNTYKLFYCHWVLLHLDENITSGPTTSKIMQFYVLIAINFLAFLLNITTLCL